MSSKSNPLTPELRVAADALGRRALARPDEADRDAALARVIAAVRALGDAVEGALALEWHDYGEDGDVEDDLAAARWMVGALYIIEGYAPPAVMALADLLGDDTLDRSALPAAARRRLRAAEAVVVAAHA
jgi:hypothetical protein